MGKSKTVDKRVLVGFSKADVTPELPFPMAGLMDKKERVADKVRDPLFARALAFSDQKTTAVVVSVDLLMITADLRALVWGALQKQNVPVDGLQLSATHTHSATGGYWDKAAAPLVMGAFRKPILDGIVTGIVKAVAGAIADMQPATLKFGETQTQGVSYNRRHKDGAIDRTLGVLDITRRKKNIRVVFFGAHPVVTAFREYNTASADYPGELIAKIESENRHGMVMVGPVGGVNVLFPEGPMDLDVHLALLTGLLWEYVQAAADAQTPVAGADVAFAAEQVPVSLALPKLFPKNKFWADILLLPLRLWVRNFGRKGISDGHKTRVPVLRVGNLVFTGYPADMGAGLGLATRTMIEDNGLRTAVVASQTDDYVGYVHMDPEYQQLETKDKGAMWMTIYENALGFGGRQMGADLLAAFRAALAKVMEK